ncbi:hypothetical protein M5M_11692 [Simiduia agarivorans SA1 = DSM 21679]|uniref:Uncharacterized protein n=1 Tax=Simiduia agarivorans (strain DSM 21679 / JCM 13881 / BCRC 17597 / SA1) TaxID=1117647 RepID=R9S511_SIMAS|nr:hypothetical protein M5M_11692 [Simiduia agarivorans SA1 = DSM 21679]
MVVKSCKQYKIIFQSYVLINTNQWVSVGRVMNELYLAMVT